MKVYCDGAFQKKPKGAGVGVSFCHEGVQHDLSRVSFLNDSNDVELEAVIVSLEFVVEKLGVEKIKELNITLVTDSDYVVREERSNSNKWQSITPLINCCSSFKLQLIMGHKGSKNHDSLCNEHVDCLAKKAMRSCF